MWGLLRGSIACTASVAQLAVNLTSATDVGSGAVLVFTAASPLNGVAWNVTCPAHRRQRRLSLALGGGGSGGSGGGVPSGEGASGPRRELASVVAATLNATIAVPIGAPVNGAWTAPLAAQQASLSALLTAFNVSLLAPVVLPGGSAAFIAAAAAAGGISPFSVTLINSAAPVVTQTQPLAGGSAPAGPPPGGAAGGGSSGATIGIAVGVVLGLLVLVLGLVFAVKRYRRRRRNRSMVRSKRNPLPQATQHQMPAGIVGSSLKDRPVGGPPMGQRTPAAAGK